MKFGGHLDYKIAAFKATGDIDGWADKRGFSAEAKSRICIGDACQGGQVVLSSVGFAGCAEFGPLKLGGGYKWGGTPDVIAGSCDLAPYRGDATAAQARTVTVRALAEASWRSPEPPPRRTLTLVGPERITDTPGAASATAFHAENTTYFIVRKPGHLSASRARGSRAYASPTRCRSRAITAKVTRRALRYDVKPIPGQTVTFAEVGKGVAKTSARHAGAAARCASSPRRAPAGRRRIVALVTSYGKPRDEIGVASYTAKRTR